MKAGWQIKPLQALCENIKQDIVDGPFGSELQRKDYIDSGVPVLKIQNIKPYAVELKKMDYVSPSKFDELKRHSFKDGDIVMTKLGDPLGVSAIVDGVGEGVIVADLVRIRANRINTKYLCYHLNSPNTNDFINSMQKGTTRPRVTLSVVRELPIVVPSEAEQQRIVTILDQAFEGIATATANAEKNLANARELFDAHVQMFFFSPKSKWEEKRLKDVVAELVTGPFGSMLHKSDYVAKGIPVVNPQNIIDGAIVPLDKTMVSEETRTRLARFNLRKKDIIIARRGEMGRCAVVEEPHAGWLCGTGSMIIRVKENVSEKYIVQLLQSSTVRKRLEGDAIGATMSNLNQDILLGVSFHLPPLQVQINIIGKLDELSAETQRLEAIYQQKLTAFDELKKSILHQAFSGQLH